MTTEEQHGTNAVQSTDDKGGLEQRLDGLEAYIKRRFDELSMELNATAQGFDMAEESLGKRFGEVLQALDSITYSGDGKTPHNMGVELETVSKTMTEAVTKIMDAADKVTEIVGGQAIDWDDKAQREQARQEINSQIQDILMACAFHDLTGQRINKTLENIRDVESQLSDTINELGIPLEKRASGQTVKENQGNTQEDIDALFS